jgi:hypothetical protein
VIDSTGRILANYISGDFSFHYKLARRTAANSWADISPGAEVAGHGPGLYIDGADNIYALEGHDLTIIQPSVEIRSAAGVWGAYSILAPNAPPTRDGSASARWDLLWPGSATHLDTVNMDETGTDSSGNTYGISYYLHASLGITPPPPPADFSLNLPSGSSVSITAGQSATIGLNIAGSNGFNQTVTLSCSGAPAGATCGVSPGSVNPNGGNVSAQISITSTARSTAAIPQSTRPGSWLWPFAILGCLLFIRRVAEKGSTSPQLRNDFCLAIIILAIGCGSGGGTTPLPTPTPPSGGGTPAGTYSLTVTGTSGAQTRSTSISLTVR